MGRIFGSDGRAVVLPLDHGGILGRVEGLEDPYAALELFLGAPCDGFLIGPGLMRRSARLFARRDAPARLLTADLYAERDGSAGHVLAVGPETAVALGADCVKLLMPWDVGGTERSRTEALVAGVVERAGAVGLPVMVEPIALSTPPGADAVAVVEHGCRVAAELGADVIKLAHPGDPDRLAAWAGESGVPLVVLGGPGPSTADELAAMVADAVAAGASGIVIGRKLWQRPKGEALELLARLHAIVHG